MRALGRSVVRLAIVALLVLLAMGGPGGISAGADQSDVAPPAPYIGPTSPGVTAVDVAGPATFNRDCGFTAPLRGGRVLWIFCDTTGTTASGGDVWPWRNNTAALATVSTPTITRDVVDSGGLPHQFIRTATNPCPAERPQHSIWPLSATTVRDGIHDHVHVYFEHACAVPQGGIGSVVPVGMGLARWTYTWGTTSDANPIRATVLAEDLFDGAWDGTGTQTDGGFGRASVHDPSTGLIYLYRCHTRWGVDDWGCEVARVPVHDAADRKAYRFRSADGAWVEDVALAAPMVMGAGELPGSGYQVAWSPALGRWAMVNVAWPGIGSALRVRVADTPWGPWSDAAAVLVPAGRCTARHCYAGYAHPSLDIGSSLAFTYYDPVVEQVILFRSKLRHHRFWDVPPSHVFAEPIDALGDAEVIRGYGDGSFQPTASISRQAMAAMLYRLADSPWGEDPGCFAAPAPDVAVGNQFCGAIMWTLVSGIATGDADGRFRPTAPVSRQAAAAFLRRMTGHGAVAACDAEPFRDVGARHLFCGDIVWLVTGGISTGYSDGTFRPTAPVTRQAFASFLHRTLPLMAGAPSTGG